MMKRKKYNPAQRLHRLAMNYGFEGRESWGQRNGCAQYDIYWITPMTYAQRINTLRQIFGNLGGDHNDYEAAACAFASTHPRKWFVRLQVHYMLGAQERMEETDYQLEQAVHLHELKEFHKSMVEQMKSDIARKSVNAKITDVRWLALPRPLTKR